jgi:hypothetical protein
MARRARATYHGRVRLFLLCLALTGCGLTDFDITQPVPEQRIDGTGLPDLPLGGLFDIPLNLDLEAKIQQQTTGPIDSITLSSLALDVTSPTGDWSFVDNIHVFVKSSVEGSTLPRVEIASVTMPGAVRTMKFDVESGVDLKPYVDEGSIVESTAEGTAPQDDVVYDGEAVFTVHPL